MFIEDGSTHSRAFQKPLRGEHTSYSQVDTYNRCPRKWAFRYHLKLDSESVSHYLVFGGAIHRTLARIYAKKQLTNEPMAVEEACDHFADDWDQSVEDAGLEIINWEDTDKDALQAKGLGMIEEFAKLPLVLEVVGVEKEFRLDLTDEVTGEVMDKHMLGYIDALVLVDGELVVHEHKTAARKWAQSRIDNDLQASIYQWATGASRVTFNVLMKTVKPRVDCYHTERSEYQMKEAVHVAVSALKAQKAGIFPAKRDWHCRGCEFARQCEDRGAI